MPISNILAGMPDYRPYTNVTPFTVRDGATYLLQLEALKDWWRDTVVPLIDSEIGGLTEDWKTLTTQLLNDWETKTGELTQLVLDAVAGIDNQVELANAAKEAAEAARDLASLYASQAEEIQDTAISGIAGSETSATRILLDSLYASVTDLNTVADILADGRLADAQLESKYQQVSQLASAVAAEIGDTDSDVRAAVEALIKTAARGVSVKEFGAVGSGAVDDTAAIVGAIAAVSSVGGGSVYFPPGTYLSTPFSVPSGVLIHGDSRSATLLAKEAAGVFISVTGSRAGIAGLRVNGDDKIGNWLVDISTDAQDVSITGSELYGVAGAGTIAIIRGRGGCNRLIIDDCFIHHANGTSVGRGILIGSTVGTVEGVKISNSTIEDIYPSTDADGICIQDFTVRVDVGISNVTFRRNAKRAIKIQAAGVRVDSCSIDIGTDISPAFCGIAVYASDAIIRGNNIRGVSVTAFIDVGAASQNLSNIQVVDNMLIGDLALRNPNNDGIRVQSASLTNSVFSNTAYAVRHGFHFENVLKNVSISGIVDNATGSAVIVDNNGLDAPLGIVVPWLVIRSITNYAFHTNGGTAPASMVIGSVAGDANFGKFGGVIKDGVKEGFYEKNAILKPSVTGSKTANDPVLNSLVVRLAELGLITDNRTT